VRKIISILIALALILALSAVAMPMVAQTTCKATVTIDNPCAAGTATYCINFTSPVTLFPGYDLLSVTFGGGTTFGTFVAGDIKANGHNVDLTKVVKTGTKLDFPTPVTITSGSSVTVCIGKVVNPAAGSYTLDLDYKLVCCPAAKFDCAEYTILPFKVVFDDNLASCEDYVYKQGQTFEIAVTHEIGTVVTMDVTDPCEEEPGTTCTTTEEVTTEFCEATLTIFSVSIPADAAAGEYRFTFTLLFPDGTKITQDKTVDVQFDIPSDPGWPEKEKEEYTKGNVMKYLKPLISEKLLQSLKEKHPGRTEEQYKELLKSLIEQWITEGEVAKLDNEYFWVNNYTLDWTNKEIDEQIKDIVKCETNSTIKANLKRKWISDHADWVRCRKEYKEADPQPKDDSHYGEHCYGDAKKFLAEIQKAIKDGKNATAQCKDFAALLLAMLRKEGIPARAVVGTKEKPNAVPDDPKDFGCWNYHVWVEMWDGKEWKVLDPTSDDDKSSCTTNNDMNRDQDAVSPKNYWDSLDGKKDGKADWKGKARTWDGEKWKDITSNYHSSSDSQSTSQNRTVTVFASTDKFMYMIGENVTANLMFVNTDLQNENTISFNTLMGRFPETYSIWAVHGVHYVLNDTGIVTMPAGGSFNVSYTITKAAYEHNGDYVLSIATNETLTNSTTFHVIGGLSPSISLPSTVDENQTFTMTLNIKNILTSPVNNVSVALSLPHYSSINDTSFSIETIPPGGTWSADFPMNISRYGTWSIRTIASSVDSGFSFEITPIKVLSSPLLEVRNDYTPHEATVGQPFVISAEITNLGDYPIANVNVNLNLIEGISTTEPMTKNIGNVSGGETKNVNWTAVGNVEGLFTYSIFAMDETGQLIDTNDALIQVAPVKLPTITSIIPDHGKQGETLGVIITGTNFSGATEASFGAGITVNSFNVDSSTQITANITIDADATLDGRNVSVTTPGGTGMLADGFTVEGDCFVATASYGTPMAEEIQILREFRDEYLLTNPVGRVLVDLYYRVSPPMADFIAEHPSLKPIARAGLAPAVSMSTVAVNTTPAEKIAIIGLMALVSVAVSILVTRRRGIRVCELG